MDRALAISPENIKLKIPNIGNWTSDRLISRKSLNGCRRVMTFHCSLTKFLKEVVSLPPSLPSFLFLSFSPLPVSSFHLQ